MKVIVAAFSKCGTKTMASALRELDLTVYDAMENYEFYSAEWLRIFKEGGTTEDFRRMYEHVDACTDVPACYFWEEIHQAFPDSKIIFLQRESEDIWWNSMKSQIASGSNFQLNLMKFLSPTFAHLNYFSRKMTSAVFGYDTQRTFFGVNYNELLVRMAYRRHNTYVLQHAPKDKLLIFNIKDGWEPLCEFLGVPKPDTPFPHKNKNASIVKELFATNPTFKRMQREFKISASLLSIVSVYLCYKIYTKRSSWYFPESIMSTLKRLVPFNHQ